VPVAGGILRSDAQREGAARDEASRPCAHVVADDDERLAAEPKHTGDLAA
jgi:hypothetical protein